jgi:tryptophan 2,3-dioxygenase
MYTEEKNSQQTDRELTAEEQQALEKIIARYGNRAVDELNSLIVKREITYDDYIQTETLLSLQQVLTDFHDELIFKVYHQQTELWFRLTLHEMQRAIRSLVGESPDLDGAIDAVTRINRYFSHLTSSFIVLIDGLSSAEFLEFRKAFGTSSGFQSSQFRAIEILAGLERNAQKSSGSHEARPATERAQVNQRAEDQATFYWERAARHLTTDEPTLTLTLFKEKHLKYLNELYRNRKPYSLRIAFDVVLRSQLGDEEDVYSKLKAADPKLVELADMLLQLDHSIVGWKHAHLKSAAKHLARAPRGTGETNWAEYLAKSMNEQRCFPELHAALATK